MIFWKKNNIQTIVKVKCHTSQPACRGKKCNKWIILPKIRSFWYFYDKERLVQIVKWCVMTQKNTLKHMSLNWMTTEFALTPMQMFVSANGPLKIAIIKVFVTLILVKALLWFFVKEYLIKLYPKLPLFLQKPLERW